MGLKLNAALAYFGLAAMVPGLHLVFAQPAIAQEFAQESAQEYGQESTKNSAEAEQEGSTVIYDSEFFSQYPGVISVRDMIDRIPGGSQIIGSRRGGDGGDQRRGFSSTDDRVLINGRRISGKGSSSSAALDRITVDQIQRIEIIRGGSPDIKVSSQEAILNIVLKSDVSSASGSWRAEGLYSTPDGRVRGGGFLSYGGALGKVDFFASVEARPDQRRYTRYEELFDGTDTLQQRIDDMTRRDRTDYNASGNLTWNLDNGDQIRLNGSFSENGERRSLDSVNFFPDADGLLVESDAGLRFEDKVNPRWEVSGDYETDLTSNLSIKFIGLYGRRVDDNFQQEDYIMAGSDPEYDTISDRDRLSSEAIGRVSLKWNRVTNHEIEVGGEYAVNTLDSTLTLFEREGGELVEQNVDGSVTQIRENRLENFIIHSWNISDDVSLESAVFSELSKIEQLGDTPNSRSLFYLRPSVDFRYDVSASRQVQLSVRRDVGQLDFGDFATTVNEDDEIVGGNPDLVPYRSWDFEGTFEQRLPEDAGFVRLSGFMAIGQDVYEQVEVQPGVSGMGNAGDAFSYGLRLKSSFRLDEIGLSGAVLEIEGEINKSEMTDAFTGEKRRPFWRGPYRYVVTYRQDINQWGMSYGASVRAGSPERFWDYDEYRTANVGRRWVSAFVEKTLGGGLTARFAVSNILGVDFGRERFLYADGRAGGILTGREYRDSRIGRHFRLSVKGAF